MEEKYEIDNVQVAVDDEVFEKLELDEITEIEGVPYFPATKCAKLLGYSKPHDAISRHCPHSVKHGVGVQTGLKADGSTAMQTVEMIFIPEGDLYRLIVRSKLPAAEKFGEWVFDEVLPSIRKTGKYSTSTATAFEVDVESLYPQDYLEKLLQRRLTTLQNAAKALNVVLNKDFISNCVQTDIEKNSGVRLNRKVIKVPAKIAYSALANLFWVRLHNAAIWNWLDTNTLYRVYKAQCNCYRRRPMSQSAFILQFAQLAGDRYDAQNGILRGLLLEAPQERMLAFPLCFAQTAIGEPAIYNPQWKKLIYE